MFMAAVQEKSFTGKVALVTGGSKGIGAGIVRRLASDGASVGFTFSSSEEKALKLVHEVESGGGKALAMKADSASAEELRAAVTKTAEIFGARSTSSSAMLAFSLWAPSTPTVSKTSTAWSPQCPRRLYRYPGRRPRNEKQRADRPYR